MIKRVNIVLMSLLVMALAEPPGLHLNSVLAAETAVNNRISSQIKEAWNCNEKATADATFTFRLTEEGYAYNIRLVKGFAEPMVIKAGLSAILRAMPFQMASDRKLANCSITCKISGDSSSPVIDAQIANDSAISTTPATELKNAPFGQKQALNDSVVRNWMYQRINYLCSSLFLFPDSKEIQDAIADLMSQMGMDSKDPQAWVSLARSSVPSITIMRNPSPDVFRSCESVIAAYFQAWQLSKSKTTLSELANAYSLRIACEALAASKAEPLPLASAAMLTNQFDMAREQYKRAEKSGDPLAKQFLERMVRPAGFDSMPPSSSVDQSIKPVGERTDWQKILPWLPVDTEEVIVAPGPFTPEKERDPRTLGQTPYTLLSQFRQLCSAVPAKNDSEIQKALQSSTIAVALHAGRDFRGPPGLGPGTQHGAEIIVFAQNSQQVSKQVMDRLKDLSVCHLIIEGTQAVVFDEMQGFGSRFVSYTCSPCPGFILKVSNADFLREILTRLKAAPKDRALSSSLMEWKSLDTTTDFWAIRHYDKTHMSFDQSALLSSFDNIGKQVEDFGHYLDKSAIGLVLYGKADNSLCFKLFSPNKVALDKWCSYWRAAIANKDYRPRDALGNQLPIPPTSLEVTMSDSSVTLEGKSNFQNTPMLCIYLLHTLGYLIGF